MMGVEQRTTRRYQVFVRHVRRYCEQADQAEVAAAAGVSRQYLNKVINDPNLKPSVQVCLAIADAVGRPLAYMFTR
jgi:DNA-binding XRE family transcriptional regulator